MAAPSYTSDLNDIDLADNVTGWAELDGHGSGGSATAETDYYIHNATCVSQSTGTKTGTVCGLQYDNGSDLSGSFTDGVTCVFAWHIYLAATAIETVANGGLRMGVGSTTGNMNFWAMGGNDFGRSPYGGWQNFAVDPSNTQDYQDGTPGAAYQFFGFLPNILSAVSKGNPHGVDVIRYGRGECIIEFGDLGNGYATFDGLATENDLNVTTFNRWGLFSLQFGSYLWKGLLSFGNATNAVDFRDESRSIVIDDTPKTYAGFNRIEISNVSSRVDWTGIAFTALGTFSRGDLEVITDADVNFDKCTFNDMGTFGFLATSTILNTTWNRCNLITTGNGTFTGCTINETNDATRAVLAASPAEAAKITDTTFISSGTKNGLEIGGTAADFTLTGVDFVGYSLVTDADKAIFVNIATGTVNLTISGGSGVSASSHVRTAGATVNVDSNVTVTFANLKDNSEVRIYTAGTNTELAGIENATAGTPDERTFAAAIAAATSVDYVIHNFNPGDLIYQTIRVNAFTWPSSDTTITIQQQIDRNAEN